MTNPCTNTVSWRAPDCRTAQGRQFVELFRTLQSQTGQIAPPRKSLVLTEAAPFAPYLSVLEFQDAEVAIMRIMGTALVNRRKIDHTGKNWFEFFAPEARPWMSRYLQALLSTPCGAANIVSEAFDRSFPIEVVSLPFADAQGLTRFIISTSTEVNRVDLSLRGEFKKQPTPNLDGYFNIGGGLPGEA